MPERRFATAAEAADHIRVTQPGRCDLTPEQRAQLRAAGRAKAAELPPIAPECAQRIAELLREAVNAHVRGGGA